MEPMSLIKSDFKKKLYIVPWGLVRSGRLPWRRGVVNTTTTRHLTIQVSIAERIKYIIPKGMMLTPSLFKPYFLQDVKYITEDLPF